LVAGVKLPATQVLGSLLRGMQEAPLPIDAPVDHLTFREIVYSEQLALRSVTVLEVNELFQNPFRHVASIPHCFFDFPLMHPLEEPERTFVKGCCDR
jgi:hypothetical protein